MTDNISHSFARGRFLQSSSTLLSTSAFRQADRHLLLFADYGIYYPTISVPAQSDLGNCYELKQGPVLCLHCKAQSVLNDLKDGIEAQAEHIFCITTSVCCSRTVRTERFL